MLSHVVATEWFLGTIRNVNGNEAETSQQINEPHFHAANPFKVILTLTLADWGLPLTLKRLNFKRGIWK